MRLSDKTILLAVSDAQLGKLLEKGVLQPAGYQVTRAKEPSVAKTYIRSATINTVIVESGMGKGDELQIVRDLLQISPALSIVLVLKNKNLYHKALRLGVIDCLVPPLKSDNVLDAVQRGIDRQERLVSWAKKRSRSDTDMLRQRVNVLETLSKVGRLVTASLDLDEVLKTIVDAAVEITNAEEGSLLILDEESGDLYMRAARNFQDEFVQTFRLPTTDSLAGEVIRTGKPILFDKGSVQKIKTSYLVKTLIYVPLQSRGRVIGVLGVDNRESDLPFQKQHITLVSALADYAAIAIENARLFAHTEIERQKLAEILLRIEDGVIVVDSNKRVIMVNRIVRSLFDLGSRVVELQSVDDVFEHKKLLKLINDDHETFPYRDEIELDDDRILDVQFNIIPDVGLAITMHDVTYFKELDRVKSDFVHTVSHDLRSPLTSILGYVELLDRVGPINERQQKFIQRVQRSVHLITELINDLLDLGRIESGLDGRKELISLASVVEYSVETVKGRIIEGNKKLVVDVPQDLPKIYGDVVRLRQVVDNLLVNSMRYTPRGGKIRLVAQKENKQVILRISDNGCGIPATDLPHIFDKFYRASNVAENIVGSGLGLAIVKSVVENHQGRVWVDSVEGEGSMFTIVLPIKEQD
ncbi:MAG: ATP-binding protein [Chloroflexota bacterium]|nr:ATP-binding protein [Chloroflexota bacterium]